VKDPQRLVKYPKDLSIINKVSSELPADSTERDLEFPIMSVSKSFCGLVSALMAAEEKFGRNEINATLFEALEAAKAAHPERTAAIEEYRKVMDEKGFGDVKISELLSHRGGVVEKFDNWDENVESKKYKDRPMDFFRENLVSRSREWRYSNAGYHMMEELINLCSDEGSYAKEVQNRITSPLGMTHTKSIYDSPEAQGRVSNIKHIQGIMNDNGEKSPKSLEYDMLHYQQQTYVNLSLGGVCSSVNDMKKYSDELGKIIFRLPNALADEAVTKKVNSFYRDARDLGKQGAIAGASTTSDSREAASHYSLGVNIFEKDGKCVVSHHGGYVGNHSDMQIEVPLTLDQFNSGNAVLPEGQEVKSTMLMQQMDSVARHSLLTMTDHHYLDTMASYFEKKSTAEEKEKFYDPGQQHWVIIKNEPVLTEWQNHLIEQNKLPQDFAVRHEEIRAAFAPVKEALHNHVIANYFDANGVIDSAKIKENFQTAEDFKRPEAIIAPSLQVAMAEVGNIFKESEKQLGLQLKKSDELPQLETKEDTSVSPQQSWREVVSKRDVQGDAAGVSEDVKKSSSSAQEDSPTFWRDQISSEREAEKGGKGSGGVSQE